MGRIRIGKSINKLIVVKRNSLTMSNTVSADSIKDNIETIYKILNLTFNIKKLNRIIDIKTAKITDLEDKLQLFYIKLGVPYEFLGVEIEFKAHSSQWFIDSNLLLAWVLWLYDAPKIITQEMIDGARSIIEKMPKRLARALLIKQLNAYLEL